MGKHLKQGNDTLDLLLDLVFSLTPLQIENLYKELLPRYSKRGRVKLYNEQGEEDPENGKVRLLPFQYRTIRTNFGDSFVRKAFAELTSYIKFLEDNVNTNSTYKSKLRKLSSSTHNNLIAHPDGWVYNKCKSLICSDRPKLSVNPYLIDDIETAREYIKTVPMELRNNSMDIQSLLLKFPTLKDE